MVAETRGRVYAKENDWEEFISMMHSGETLEVDAEIFNYFLGVLPPVFMGKTINGQHYSFGFAEGEETIVGFWLGPKDDGIWGNRCFCRDTGVMNHGC